MAKKKKLVRIFDERVNRIVDYLSEKNISKAELSRISGLSEPHIINVLAGRKKLSLPVLEKISNALEKPFSFFNEGVILRPRINKKIDKYITNNKPQKIIGYKTVNGEIFKSENDVFSFERDMYRTILKNISSKNGFFTFSGMKISYVFECDGEKIEKFADFLKNKSGCYMWLNINSYFAYTGSASDIYKRAQNFINFTNDYAGYKINNARKNTSIEDWHFFVLEFCNENLKIKESELINYYNTIDNGYNIAKPYCAENNLADKDISVLTDNING